jgi:hypothetical protein
MSPRRATGRGGRCGARGSQQQAQPEQADGPDHEAVEEQGAGRAGHVIAEYREMGDRTPGKTAANGNGKITRDAVRPAGPVLRCILAMQHLRV